ncbi:MAG: helix-turn-helix domain-containing protein [Brevundimonas sp.]|jgi:hypothetical protein|nr:MAG: helix-turn-helix domain-containing protein [Brevundimonas sp.]
MCERCDGLAAENARLRDELAEWRRHAAEGSAALVETDDTARWMLALGVPRLIARVAMLMASRAGRVVPGALIGETGSKDWDGLRDPGASGKVCIYKLRRALIAAGVAGKIEMIWGVGYRMPVATAEALRDLVEGCGA